MTYTKLVRKTTILPVLLAIASISASPFLMDASADFLPTEPVPDTAILPDITPGIPKHLYVHQGHQSEWLRFTNVWGNIGEGGLEFKPIIEVENPEEGTVTQAFQSLYDEEGEFRDSIVPVWSEIVTEFEFHETHNHWHIAGVGEFSVREAIPILDENDNVIEYEIGDIAILPDGDESTAIKVGFCISDVYPYDGTSPGTSLKWYWECEVGYQGIQPGWVDQYHQATEDNEINITGLTEGTYFLTHTWNPENFFVDENDENDTAWMLFEISKNNNGNGNRKVTELGGFAPACDLENDTTPGLCAEVTKNS